MGNICRSPTAEAVLRTKLERAGLAERVSVDSAGTHGYHAGEPPYELAQRTAADRGYDLSGLRCRALTPEDRSYDLVLGMDRANVRLARRTVGDDHPGVRLFLQDERGGREIPDPYGAGRDAFERVLDMIEVGATALADEIAARLAASET
jgi:protein-tyrosine phosphatase